MILINIIQLIVPLLLIGVILLQVKGSGLSSSFGGGGEFYRSKQSIEKILVWATALLAFFFGVISLLFTSK